MRKLHILGVFLFALLSCNETQEKGKMIENAIPKVSTEEWVKKTRIDSKANEILSHWSEYNDFDSSIDALYEIKNVEDVSIGIEDLIEKQKLLLKSTYPEAYDLPQIKSRQKVLLTYILKVKGKLEYRLPVEDAIKELIIANNAMRLQFNVEVNNPLDSELLLEEE